MEWLIVIGLIAMGITLVVAEILFIPGVIIAGSIGVLLSSAGVYCSYKWFDQTIGTVVLLSTIFLNILALYVTFRGRTWERFSLRQSHTAKVNEETKGSLQVGDIGLSISVLKPIGKAIFNDTEYEVRSNGSYIEENQDIRILKIESDRIIVEPNNN